MCGYSYFEPDSCIYLFIGVRYLVVGCICLALGTVGVFLPILPTVCHFIYFVFFVKTIKGERGNEEL